MNIISRRNIFPDNDVARYNLAAWLKPESNNTFLMGREVSHPASNGEPDNGVLKFYELDDAGQIIQDRLIDLETRIRRYKFGRS